MPTRHPRSEAHKSVLLVEDDPSQQQLWGVVFKRISKGIRLRVVSNVEAALGELREGLRRGHGPDLVLCDVYLEGDRTGVDLQRQCASEFPHLPFILTSGMTVEELGKKFGFEPRKGPAFLWKKRELSQIQKDLAERLLGTGAAGVFDALVPSSAQLLAGISVALGLTASVIQMKPRSGTALDQDGSDAVRNAPIVKALKDAEVKQATDDLLTKGLTPWLVAKRK
jgi:CheY-like chemotaxis protein